jgi:hypothetical protein
MPVCVLFALVKPVCLLLALVMRKKPNRHYNG